MSITLPRPPRDLAADPGYLDRLVSDLERQLNHLEANTTIPILRAEPEKVTDGQLVLADGAHWNPGEGPGFYFRFGGAWWKCAVCFAGSSACSSQPPAV